MLFRHFEFPLIITRKTLVLLMLLLLLRTSPLLLLLMLWLLLQAVMLLLLLLLPFACFPLRHFSCLAFWEYPPRVTLPFPLLLLLPQFILFFSRRLVGEPQGGRPCVAVLRR